MRVSTLLACLGIHSFAYSIAILPSDYMESEAANAISYGNLKQYQWAVKGSPSDGISQRPPSRRPPKSPTTTNGTIYDTLARDIRFSKVMRLINLNNATIDLLKSDSMKITFFAPPDSAFPKRRHHNCDSAYFDSRVKNLFSGHADEYSTEEDMMDMISCGEALDDEMDEDRKRRFRKMIAAVLSYHILPSAVTLRQMESNSTFATNLTLPSNPLGDATIRLRIERARFSPAFTVNVFSHISGPSIETRNGNLYIITRPLFPPPAVFDQLFFAQRIFSVLTSVLQRVDLTAQLNSSTNGVTIFAPTNRAFGRLPPKLRAFLFSSFGARALKALLQFHIVPSHVVHTDYLLNATSEKGTSFYVSHPDLSPLIWSTSAAGDQGRCQDVSEVRGSAGFNIISSLRKVFAAAFLINPFGQQTHSAENSRWISHPPHHRPSEPPIESNTTLVLPTLLASNTSLTFEVIKFAPPRSKAHWKLQRVRVNGVHVDFTDGVAANGAFHVIDSVLNPRRGRQPNHTTESQDEWEGWEEWLPDLANQL